MPLKDRNKSPSLAQRQAAPTALEAELDYYRQWLLKNPQHRDVQVVKQAMRSVERGDWETDWDLQDASGDR